MYRIDLHTHSNMSDGTLSPEELIGAACNAGLAAVALTDHDTAAGLARAAAAADALSPSHPFEFIPGIELSVSYMSRELHLVGLHLDLHSPSFQSALSALQDNRDARNLRMIGIMQDAGIDISMEQLRREQGSGILTRANFARYLMEHGYIQTIQEGFDRYLDVGKPFYVPREYMDPETAITLIHSVSGIAILAHPLLYHFSVPELEQAAGGLKAMGLDGLEAYYSMNSGYDTVHMKKLAQAHGLILSGGSDFHGSNKPHIRLGFGRGNLCIPEDVLKKQKAYLAARHTARIDSCTDTIE